MFLLFGLDLASDRAMSRVFSSLEKSWLPREVKSPEWNLPLVLKNLTHQPYEVLKLSADKHMIWEACILLALALARQVSKLLSLSYHHSMG